MSAGTHLELVLGASHEDVDLLDGVDLLAELGLVLLHELLQELVAVGVGGGVVEHARLDHLGVDVALLLGADLDGLLDGPRGHKHQHQHLLLLSDAVGAVLRLLVRLRILLIVQPPQMGINSSVGQPIDASVRCHCLET
eukprot:scaffold170102_cov49-Prasinocladus_malaysianus.AAC.1